jgi:hypothetical protein
MTGSAGPPPMAVAQSQNLYAMQQNALAQQQAAYSTSATNWTITTTGATTSVTHNREFEVSRIVKREKGYFYVISVDACDEVFYRVWKGGRIPYYFAKIFGRFGRDIEGNNGTYQSVTKRSHLPATLGSAYDMIHADIDEDRKQRNHGKYVADMLTTPPENLKMIGDLERLDKGDPDAEPMPQPPLNGAAFGISGNGYTYAMGASGGAISASGDMEVEGSLTVGGKSIEEMVTEQMDALSLITKENDKGETKNG